MVKPAIHEIFEQAASLKTKKEKIAYLQEMGQYPAFKDILRINFDYDVVCLLPDGETPYRKDDAPEGMAYQSLHREYRRFTYFFKGGEGMNLSPLKRESMWIDLLESLSEGEADLLAKAKDRRLKYKGITRKLVEEAFPTLLKK
tara:strand:- start:178 stop:609 length:432 start_codon:yes stop_codon:yes gene_type:complete